MRRLAVLLPLALLLGACTPEPPPRPGPVSPALPPAAVPDPAASGAVVPGSAADDCPDSGVRLQLGEVSAAMGLRVMGIELINCGHDSYRLNGFPVISALAADRAPLDVGILNGVSEISASITGRDGPPRPVVLRRGEPARAVLAWRNTYTDVSEAPAAVAYLDVAPAVGEPAQLLTPDGPLDLGSTGRLGVSPWLPVSPGTDRTDGPPDPASPGRSPAADAPAAPRRD